MTRFAAYTTQFNGLRGSVTTLPRWGKAIILLAALPGLVLLLLSIVVFLVSLLALFLLTGPVYRLVRAITAGRSRTATGNTVVSMIDPADADYGSPGRKQVQGTLIE
jgi:hypothetical protein